MDEYQEPAEGQPKSAYNSAISQIMRLDRLYEDCHRLHRRSDYQGYFRALKRIWIELSNDATLNQKKNWDRWVRSMESNGVYSLNDMMKIEKPILYNKIVNYLDHHLGLCEEWLRMVMNDQGKGSKYEDDMDSYMN